MSVINQVLQLKQLQQVISFLEPHDLAKFAQCCRFFQQASNGYCSAFLAQKGIELRPDEKPLQAVQRIFRELFSCANVLHKKPTETTEGIEWRSSLREALVIPQLWTRFNRVVELINTETFCAHAREVCEEAIRRGNTGVFRLFLERGCPECSDFAAERGNLSMVQLCYSHGSIHLDRALEIAAREGHLAIVDFILQQMSMGKTLKASIKKWAMVGGRLDIYQRLSERDTAPEDLHGLKLIESIICNNRKAADLFEKASPYYKSLAFILAAGKGNLSFFPNMGEDDNYFALLAAGFQGNVETFKVLVSRRLDVYALNEAVLFAIRKNHQGIIDIASRYSHSISYKTYEAWFLEASKLGHLPMIEKFVEQMGGPRRELGYKAILLAAGEGHLHLIQYLSIYLDRNYLYELIEAAAAGGHLLCVQELWKLRPVDQLSKDTTLDAARAGHFADVVKWIEEQPI